MKKTGRLPVCFLLIVFTAVIFGKTPEVQAVDSSRPIKVFIWFDTEDYILPEADEALLRISDFLAEEGIKGTFKIVGEKARVLEKRDRRDIISSLKRHEIGYHTDMHSAQPTPAMYLSDLDWSEGVREFTRREYQGFLDVRRITGQEPYCYGQPGGSWGPQAFEALRNWGIRVYLDSIDIIDVNKSPFWYAGVLTLCSLEHEMRVELRADSDLDNAKIRFAEAREEILAGSGPGVVSIFYHPCEFVHAEFWDGANFSKGDNPGPDEWKNPPLKSEEEIAAGYRNFEGFVRYIKSFPEVEFVTAGQALEIFPDQAVLSSFSPANLDLLAGKVREQGVTYQVVDNIPLTAAEIFQLLCSYAEAGFTDNESHGPWQLPEQTVSGPVSVLPQAMPVKSTIDQYRRTLRDVINFISSNSRIPDSIWLGSVQVSPESFLMATADFLGKRSGNHDTGVNIEFHPAELKAGNHVKERPSWDWIVFPEGFTAPAMMEKARLQAWSLKPAVSRQGILRGGLNQRY